MRQFETSETDSNGLPIYYVGAGEMTPGGVTMCYTATYINPKGKGLEYKYAGDGEAIYLYQKSTVNSEAVDEIVRQMKLKSTGAIKFSGVFLHHDRIPMMFTCRIGRKRWSYILRFTDYCIGMGEGMAKTLLAAIQSDAELNSRLVTD